MSDQQLLRESVGALPNLDSALLQLYIALFRDHPHLRSLFPGSIKTQRGRLKASLLRLIESLDHPETIIPVFEELGRDHRKLGVRPAHYAAFGDALIEALRGTPGWRDEYQQAWLRLYCFAARTLIDAADEAVFERPYFDATVVYHERRRPDLAILLLSTDQPYPFKAGQHATLQSPQLPKSWRRYSMANPPDADGRLEFHVRAKGTGGLSDVLVRQTKVGDKLRVGPARGVLTLERASGFDLLLIAGGTGLAPIKSILGELGRQPRQQTSLFFGARTQDDLYDLELLANYARQAPWLRLVPAVSDARAHPYEPGLLPDVVARHGPWDGHSALVSGPPDMVTILLRRLPELGVSKEYIVYDPE